MLVMFEQFFHQAHGPTGVVSDRAVNDLDVQHSPSANFEKLYPSRSQTARFNRWEAQFPGIVRDA
jgi:hypothetical protein